MASALEDIGKFVRDRREARGWSQVELAERSGTSQQQIGRIESGAVKHSRALPTILAALGTDMSRALPAAIDPENAIPKELLVGGRDFPIYATVQGGDGSTIVNFDPIDFVLRPGPLLHVREGFGVMVEEESMAPAFEPGDIALINPRILPRKGKNAVLLGSDGSPQVKGLIKRFEGQTEGEWKVSQWNPRQDFTLSKALWPRCYAVVGKYDAR